LLCHTSRVAATVRATNRSAPRAAEAGPAPGRERSNSITPSRRPAADARAMLTVVQLDEFGFFSGLRDQLDLGIIIARFDRTVLIGT
jgi:hypothetical protein